MMKSINNKVFAKHKLRQLFHIDHLIVTVLTLIIIKVLVAIAINLDFLSPVVRSLENFSMTDIYYRIMNTSTQTETDCTITLVDMTELTHRKDIAKVIRQIKELKPKVLGVDIIFEGHMSDEEGDHALVEACLDGDSANIVWAYKLTKYDDKNGRFQDCLHSFFVTEGNQKEGFVNLVSNPAKSIKQYAVTLPYKDTVVYSLPARIALATSDVKLANERSHTINYKPVTFPVVSCDSNSLANFSVLITDHIVLLGTTQEERDKYYTPIGQKSGLEILAYTILSMVEEEHIHHAGTWMAILWALLVGYIVNLLDFFQTKRMGKRRSTIMVFVTQSKIYNKVVSLLVMIFITGVSFELFAKCNYFVNTLLALSTIVLIGEGRLLYVGLLSVLKRKKQWKWVQNSIYNEKNNN